MTTPTHFTPPKNGHDPRKTKVALLVGGWNSERNVSLMSGKKILESMIRLGYQVTSLDLSRDIKKLVDFLTPKPDIVFLGALHGHGVEDGRLQGLLDILQVRYTHSEMTASAIGMNKVMTLKFMQSIGVPTPKSTLRKWADICRKHPMHTPYVIKPLDEGSSVGVYIIQDNQTPLEDQVNWSFGDDVMVEEYIPGKELSCAVLNNKALGILELEPKSGFYDYSNKYTDDATTHYMPARIPDAVYEKVMEDTLKVHQALGCSGATRCDIRYDPDTGRLAFLEINTLPGYTPLSIVPEIAAYAGISYDESIYLLIEEGLCRALPR
ncbi:MAG: D-alanine--D-alanine ligase [Holosporaceae bacterium]|nr:MAG: D-alanine--D-alanine ligase [Holosporaceae bacterium]